MNLGAMMNNIVSNFLKPLKKGSFNEKFAVSFIRLTSFSCSCSRNPAQQNQIDTDKLTDQPDDVVPPVAAEGALGQSSSSQSHGINIGNVAEGSIGDDSVHSTVEVQKP
ncbi:hypothetical protein ACFX1R_004028 [Malus domestica]